MKNIYFVSESIPYPGHGSFIIFYRHLVRLEQQSYTITLVIPDYSTDADGFLEEIKGRWNIIKIPITKWWFLLPYRYNYKILRIVRYIVVYLLIKNRLDKKPPGFIITYFYNQFYNSLAIFLKNRYKCKLGIFLHDDKHLLNKTSSKSLLKYDQYLTKNADVIWTVSDSLFIPDTDKKKYKLLYPIPAGANAGYPVKVWNDDFMRPVVGFSGTIYDAYESVVDLLATELSKYDGRLILILKNPSVLKWLQQLKVKHKNITVVDAFSKPSDAISYLRDCCTALFCGYPNEMDQMPWITSCFPSKFIEFSHLGLPIILTSPPKTALSDWSIKHHWNLFSSTYNNADFKRIIEDITQKDGWNENVVQTKNISNSIFNPDTIHGEFLSEITTAID